MISFSVMPSFLSIIPGEARNLVVEPFPPSVIPDILNRESSVFAFSISPSSSGRGLG